MALHEVPTETYYLRLRHELDDALAQRDMLACVMAEALKLNGHEISESVRCKLTAALDVLKIGPQLLSLVKRGT